MKASLLSTGTTLIITSLSGILATKTDGNLALAAETAFFVSLIATGTNFVLMVLHSENADDIKYELISRGKK